MHMTYNWTIGKSRCEVIGTMRHEDALTTPLRGSEDSDSRQARDSQDMQFMFRNNTRQTTRHGKSYPTKAINFSETSFHGISLDETTGESLDKSHKTGLNDNRRRTARTKLTTYSWK